MDGNQKPSDQSNGSLPLQPGVTITPGVATVGTDTVTQLPAEQSLAAPTPVLPPAEAAAVPQAVLPPAEPETTVAPPTAQPAVEATPQVAPDAPVFTPEQPLADDNASLPYQNEASESASKEISWSASEFIAHNKSSSWYMMLFGAAAVIAVLVWLLTKDVFSAVVVLLALGVLGAYGSRKPRELQYVVDEHGVAIGQKQYSYHAFRSFSVITEGAFSSIEFIPLKRLAPAITIYYDPKDEDEIIGVLSQHVPFEPHKRDAIDQLMHRIRF